MSGADVKLVSVIPFSDEIPDVPMYGPTIFYGSCNFIDNVWKSGKWSPGAWCNNSAFRYDNYLYQYGDQLLNYDGRVMTMEKFGKENHPDDELFFVRPIRDLKEFAGELITFGNYSEWFDGISHGGFSIKPDLPIVVATPKNIIAEYRLFLVNSKVVAWSRYKKGDHFSRFNIIPDVPDAVKTYAEEQAERYSPLPVFVMDVCETESGLRIVELGSFNSAGLYSANEHDIVDAINKYVLNG